MMTGIHPKAEIAHLVRKIAHFKQTPFIRNQILNHVMVAPAVIAKEYDDGDKPLGTGLKFLFLEKSAKIGDFLNHKVFRSITKKNISEIGSFIKANDIRLLHFHYGTDAGLYHRILKLKLAPSLVSFYGYDCSSFPKRFLGLGKVYLKRRVFKNITNVLAMSHDMKADLIKLGCPEEKILVHYFGIDISKFINHHRKYDSKKTIQLLIMASLEERKGHLTLLKALRKLLDQNIGNFSLTIIGQGILEKQLKQYIERNGLKEVVRFKASVDYNNSELVDSYNNSDIYVQPSVTAPDGDKEGIPTALLEAMANGLPVISTFHAGIPDIIQNGINGILVNEYDVDALSGAIGLLLNDNMYRQKLGVAGMEHVMKNLDLKIKQAELEEIYNSLIKSKV